MQERPGYGSEAPIGAAAGAETEFKLGSSLGHAQDVSQTCARVPKAPNVTGQCLREEMQHLFRGLGPSRACQVCPAGFT